MLRVARRAWSPFRYWSTFSPEQVWRRVRGTWDCRCEHEPQIRSACISPQIEHRLFSQITMNWRGRPLTSHQVIVDMIANTSTATGLVVKCVLDTGPYPTGVKYTDKDVTALPTDPPRLPRRMELPAQPELTDTPDPTRSYFIAGP